MTLKETFKKIQGMWKDELHKKGTPEFDKEKYALFSRAAFYLEELIEMFFSEYKIRFAEKIISDVRKRAEKTFSFCKSKGGQ